MSSKNLDLMSYQSASLVYWMQHAKDKVIIPASVDIDLTNICNQDCFYCNSADHRAAAPGGPNAEIYLNLLDKLASWRNHSPNSVGTLHTITYPGGGEPTLLRGFERVIEHTIDLGFLTALTTNGYKLNKLFDCVPHEKLRKMAWIGIDMDAGSKHLYESIRKTKNKYSIFNRVVNNAQNLISVGVNVDIKILLCGPNITAEAIKDIFQLMSDIRPRLLYFRTAVIDNKLIEVPDSIKNLINYYSVLYNQKIKFESSRREIRSYNRCHQMFQFPVFCADGHIYTCCENKGNHNFSIGRWDQDDFRDIWLGHRHYDVYHRTNTRLCKPCRPNRSNNAIQSILDNNEQMESLFL